MAYVNTGTQRSLTFTLNKTVGGDQSLSYPKEYDGRLAFPGYAAITDVEAQQLTDVQYAARLAAFIAYVQSIEAGFDATDFTNASTAVNLVDCVPPPTTTTTTTAAVTTTTTAAVTTTTTAAVTTTTTAAVTTTTTTAAITTTTTTA